MTPAVITRDRGTCCLSPSSLMVENAHVIPKAEKEWFTKNNMHLYNNNEQLSDVIRDVRNGLTLGVEIHQCWNALKFTFVPKNGHIVLHVFTAIDATRLCSFYHNVQLRVPNDFSTYFYYARFAMTVILLLNPFLQSRNRAIKVKASTSLSDPVPPPPLLNTAPMASAETKTTSEDEDGNGENQREIIIDPDEIVDEEAELQEDLKLVRKRFGDAMEEEKEWSSSYVFQHINWYPGLRKVQRMKRRLLDAMAGGESILKALPSLRGSKMDDGSDRTQQDIPLGVGDDQEVLAMSPLVGEGESGLMEDIVDNV
ncbi:hypothetical protein FRB93_005055 [Tulasnella sp. JGI-2019a]|nr:hypothetical protein FRB93_005055 [Tulasnella sp. JGI-2019a]